MENARRPISTTRLALCPFVFLPCLFLISGGKTNPNGKGKANCAHPAAGAGASAGGSVSDTSGINTNARKQSAAGAGPGARVKSEPAWMGEGGGVLAVPMGTQVRSAGTRQE